MEIFPSQPYNMEEGQKSNVQDFKEEGDLLPQTQRTSTTSTTYGKFFSSFKSFAFIMCRATS